MNDLHAIMANQRAESDMRNRMESVLEEFQESAGWNSVGHFSEGSDWSELPNFDRISPRKRSSHSYVYDRADGRFLPYYENEWDLRRMRAASRNLSAFSTVSLGALEKLDGYTIKNGYEFAVKAKDDSREEELASLVKIVQSVVDKFLHENAFLGDMDSEIHKGSRSDGDKFIALYPQTGYVARAMIIEPDEVTEPLNATPVNRYLGFGNDKTCFWEYGILTCYSEELKCHDTETPLYYHVVKSPDGSDWDVIPESRMVHIKRNVGRRAKRGVSDFFAMLEDLEGEGKLNSSLQIGMRVLANIPFAKEYNNEANIGGIPNGADGVTLNLPRTGGGSRSVDRINYEPGTIPIVKGGKWVAGPMATMRTDSLMSTLSYLLKRMGSFWVLPNFMMSGDTDTALYSAVLAIGSPFVNARERDQKFYGDYFAEIITKALRIAYETGQISSLAGSFERLMNLIEITYQAPQVTMTDETEQAQRDASDISAGIVSVQTIRERRNIDHEQEEGRIASERESRPVGTIASDSTEQGAVTQQSAASMQENCGTGAGGFKHGNTCAKGGGGGQGENPRRRKLNEAEIAYIKGEIPDGAVVHGRRGMKKLRDDVVVQGSMEWDVAVSYSNHGKSDDGSMWVLRPNENSATLDLNDYRDMQKMKDMILEEWEDGSLPWTLSDAIEFELRMAAEARPPLTTTAEEIIDKWDDVINPDDIVNSAGWWDDSDFVTWAWDKTEVDFIYTSDGAVVLNHSNVDTIRVSDHIANSGEHIHVIDGVALEDMYVDEPSGQPIAESKNCGTGAGGFKYGNTCAKGGGKKTEKPMEVKINRASQPGVMADATSDSVPEKYRLPKGFHNTDNSRREGRDVKVDPFHTEESVIEIPIENNFYDQVMRNNRKKFGGRNSHLGDMAKVADSNIWDGSTDPKETTVVGLIQERLSNRKPGRKWNRKDENLEKILNSGLALELDQASHNLRESIPRLKLLAKKQGMIAVKDRGENVRKALIKELEIRLGKPDESQLSPSKYFFTGNGRSIRVSNHAPFYFFEDSGVNIVPGAVLKGSDVPVREGNFVNIKKLASQAIEANQNLPPVDVAAAKKRVGITECYSCGKSDARFLLPEEVKEGDPKRYQEWLKENESFTVSDAFDLAKTDPVEGARTLRESWEAYP